jgi:hypothetical protein
VPTTPADATVPRAADTRNAATRPLYLALAITYSRTQPDRVGEVALFPCACLIEVGG